MKREVLLYIRLAVADISRCTSAALPWLRGTHSGGGLHLREGEIRGEVTAAGAWSAAESPQELWRLWAKYLALPVEIPNIGRLGRS